MSLKHRVATAVLRRHALLRPVLPRGHHAYPFPGGRIYLDLRESPMMLARVLRFYERPRVRALLDRLPPAGTFVDVGGNKGDFALIAARFQRDGGRILCVEPFPANCAWIRRSVARNGYRSIEVVEAALGDAEATADLYVGPVSGWHTLNAELAGRSIGTTPVAVRRLDDLLAERDIGHVDVIKIDVEGGEAAVLQGARQTLATMRPLTLLLDLHPPLVDPVAICADLQRLGFELRDPDDIARPLAVTRTTRDVVAMAG